MNFWTKAKLVCSSIWGFVEPFVKIFLSKAGPVLASAAMQAVQATAVSLAAKDGSTKRDNAYQLIVEDLKTQGLSIGVDVTTSMINAAIEAAVQKLKADAA